MLSAAQKEKIKAEFAPVPDDPVETAQRTIAWGLYFFGDADNAQHFYLRTGDVPVIHFGIHLALSTNHRFYYCTSPREFAKTTHLRINTLYRIYYAMEPYILLIGKIGDSGKSMLRDLKYDIENNPKLIDIYGRLRPEGFKGAWSAHEIELANGVFVRSIGVLGNVRGGLKRGWRYTLIIGDDLQDSGDMREPTTLQAHKTFWEREVEYAVDSTYGKVRYIGNLLGTGCLLEAIMKDPKYRGTSFHALVKKDGEPDLLDGPLAARNGESSKSTWESHWPTVKLIAEAEEAIVKGRRAVWLAERQNIITDELARRLTGYRFHNMQFRRDETQNVLVGPDYPDPIPVYTYLAIDPAFASTKSADERALEVFAKGRILQRVGNAGDPTWLNCIWLLEYIYNFMAPNKIISLALELHRRYYLSSVIVEAIGGAQIYEPMMSEITAGDAFFARFPFSPVFIKRQEANKKDRIYAGLQPRMSLGQIFIRQEMREFMNECEMFDSLASPHLLDALEFGNRNAPECIEPLYQAPDSQMRRHEKMRQQQEADFRGWGPKNLSELSV